MATSLATLRIKVENDGRGLRDFKRGLADGQKQVVGFEKKVFSARKALVAFAGVAGAAFAVKKMFDLGSAVEETASKFNTVFGPATESVQGFIDDFATMAGLSNEAAQEVLATTGAIAQGMGFAQSASGAFAQEVVKLAGDLSSFNNIPIAETSRAIQSALTGERESLKRLGVVILETDVQKRALVTTGKESAAALTQEEKAAATLALITERAGVAMGDLARTQDSAANTARRLGARWRNIREIAASSLLPVMSQLLNAFDTQTESTSILEQQIKSTARSLTAFIIEMQLAVSTLKVVDAELNLFFAELVSGFRDLGRMLGMDLPDNVRAAELALNNLKIEAAELREVLLLALNAMQGTGEAASGVAPQVETAEQVLARMGLSARLTKDEMKQMHFALVGVGGAFTDVVGPIETAKTSVSDFVDEGVEQLSAMDITVVGFADDFANRIGEATRSGRAAFDGFVDAAIAALTRLAAKMVIFETLKALFPQSRIGIDLGQALGLFDHGGTIKSGQVGIVGELGPEIVQGPARVTSRAKTAQLLGGTSAPASAPAPVVFNQTVNFNVDAIDAAGVATVLQQQKGTIAGIVANAAQSSSAFRRSMRGGS